jgi:ATP-dependent RNA helicase RhlE
LDVLEILVLDEADKMLSLGFSEELDTNFSGSAQKTAKFVIFGNISPELQQLIASLLHQPVEINLAKQDDNLIEQHVYTIDKRT